MEFLKTLDEAKQLGVSKEDFIKIWEFEMKLKQQREETKALELRLACSKISEPAKFQEVEDQVKRLLDNHLKLQKQHISQLKESLSQQNKAQLQEISTLLENQMTVAVVIIKNELMDLLNQFATTLKIELHQSVVNMFKSAQPASAGSAGNYVECSEGLQQEKPKLDQATPYSSQESSDNDSEEYIDSFPTEDGAIFSVRNVEQVAASKRVKQSSEYILPDLPVIVYMSIWFNSVGNLSAELSLSGETEEPLKACRIFTVSGYIKNRNSGTFSLLFEGISQPLRRLKPDREIKAKAAVRLKTGSGSYDDVTLDELNRRGFVINNSCHIKWFIRSEEADTTNEN